VKREITRCQILLKSEFLDTVSDNLRLRDEVVALTKANTALNMRFNKQA
jgi:hypothetical protein